MQPCLQVLQQAPAPCSLLHGVFLCLRGFALACACVRCRAVQAALAATASPLLEVGINQATGIVWNITGPPDMSLFEVRTRSAFGRLRLYVIVAPSRRMPASFYIMS
jgi:hypothetical protein